MIDGSSQPLRVWLSSTGVDGIRERQYINDVGAIANMLIICLKVVIKLIVTRTKQGKILWHQSIATELSQDSRGAAR